MEIFEIMGLEDGVFDISDLFSYFGDMWNIFDWLCYTIYLYAFYRGQQYIDKVRNPACGYSCEVIGHLDEHDAMAEASSLKLYLSMTICIQVPPSPRPPLNIIR